MGLRRCDVDALFACFWCCDVSELVSGYGLALRDAICYGDLPEQPSLDRRVQDFGEYLVEIRDQLDVPLPVRVRGWRVFLGIFLESFCALALSRCNYRSIVEKHDGLTEPTVDIDEVLHAFKRLENLTASREQIEQARDTFNEQMQRRCDRFKYELHIWFQALQSGGFLGTLVFTMIFTSGILSSLTGRDDWWMLIYVGGILAQVIVVAICLKGWHRP